MLYRDVVYWFGPFTPYLHAGFFAVFGSSFGTLTLAGIVGSAAALAALFACTSLVAGRRAAFLWTAIAIPLLVFMRYSGGGILGMGYRMWHAAAFALAACAVAFSRRPSAARAAGAGALVGMAGLCRADWGLLAAAALAAGLALAGPGARDAARRIAIVVATAAAVFALGMLPFVAAAGLSAFRTESFALLVGLPAQTRASALAWTGADRWPWGVWSWIYATAFWLCAFWMVEAAALRWSDPGALRRRLPALLAGGAVLAIGAFVGFPAGSLSLSWVPVVCVLAIVRALREGRRDGLLLAAALIGLLGSARRIFDLRDFGYVAPPVLFALVCAAALVRASIRRRGPDARRRLGWAVEAALATTAAAFFALRLVQYAADPRVPIPGTGGWLTASAARAAELDALARRIRERTPAGSALVVFPDAAVVNFLAGRENPLRHKLYVAGYLGPDNEAQVVDELEHEAPAAIAIVDRPDGQLPNRVFGEDYGGAVRRWIEARYDLAPVVKRPADPAGSPALLGFPRTAAAPPPGP